MKRQLVVATSLALLVFAASPSFAVNGNIGIYGDTGQAICAAPLGYQTTMTLYVYALQQGASLGGITGAEYSIGVNATTDWTYSEDFSPVSGASTVGSSALNYFGTVTGGINIAWPSCESGGGSILLQTVTVIDLTGAFAGAPVTLKVQGHTSPGNQFFRCPLFTLCDDPVFTKVCLGQDLDVVECPFPPFALACTESSSGEFFINPEPGFNCTVAVEDKTWSDVKSLFN